MHPYLTQESACAHHEDLRRAMRSARGIPTRRRRRSFASLRLGLTVVLTVIVALVVVSPALALEKQLTARDAAVFGISVAVDGDTLVVGARGDDHFAGAVYVFRRSGDDWAQSARLTASDRAPNDELGSSVAIEGDTIVAGAPAASAGADPDAGAVYTFARTGAADRTETAKLTATAADAKAQLGGAVAIDGDTIVAGSPTDRVGTKALQGTAYTFARTGPRERTETGRLVASDGAASDRFGTSVAIDGDTIVIGAPRARAVYTFARAGAAVRRETARLTASPSDPDARLGQSVAIDGDTIVAGAPKESIAKTAKGAVYTFTRSGGDRTQSATLAASDGEIGDALGASVAIDGATIVSGAVDDDDGDIVDEGSVYTFARSGAATRGETGKQPDPAAAVN